MSVQSYNKDKIDSLIGEGKVDDLGALENYKTLQMLEDLCQTHRTIIGTCLLPSTITPTGADMYCSFQLTKRDVSDNITLTIQPLRTSSPKIYLKVKNAGVWSDWEEIFDKSILGVVNGKIFASSAEPKTREDLLNDAINKLNINAGTASHRIGRVIYQQARLNDGGLNTWMEVIVDYNSSANTARLTGWSTADPSIMYTCTKISNSWSNWNKVLQDKDLRFDNISSGGNRVKFGWVNDTSHGGKLITRLQIDDTDMGAIYCTNQASPIILSTDTGTLSVDQYYKLLIYPFVPIMRNSNKTYFNLFQDNGTELIYNSVVWTGSQKMALDHITINKSTRAFTYERKREL